MSQDDPPSSQETNAYPALPLPPTDLRLLGALARTAFSSEQTLMSWIRTALSLFTFGFSISQFFRFLEQQQGISEVSAAPRQLGISLICVGIVALALATIEHVLRVRELKTRGLPKNAVSLVPVCSAAGLLVMGIAAFLAVYFNWTL